MTNATTMLHHEHDAIVMGLRILAEIDRHAVAKQAVDAADLQSLVDFFSEFADACHHGKEEQLLFPRLMQTGDRQTREAIERLLDEAQQGALAREFEVFERQVMGPERHEALHALLHTLQQRYSI